MAALALSCGLIAAAWSEPAQAQNQSVTTSATCLASPGGRSLVIVVPTDQAAALEGRGFVRRSCSTNKAEYPEFKTKICELAAKAGDGLNDMFRRQYGATPGEMCSLANAAGHD
jgi:hypothetical protein